MVVAGFLLLLKVLYGEKFFEPVLDSSSRFWPYLWIDISSSA